MRVRSDSFFRRLKALFQKNNDQYCKYSNKERFESALKIAGEVFSKHPEDLFDLMRVLSKKIQYSYFSDFLTYAGVEDLAEDTRDFTGSLDFGKLFLSEHDEFLNENERHWFDEVVRSRAEKEYKTPVTVDLAFDVVLPWPWRKRRLVDCMRGIGNGRLAGDWKYDDLNHLLIFAEEMGVYFVAGGNHSLTTGILKNSGQLPCHLKYDLGSIYDQIKCDGEFYFKADGTPLMPVFNLEAAILFELGRVVRENKLSYFDYKKLRFS